MSKKYWNEEIETISRDELEKYQLERIREQITAAYDKSPYYRQSFEKAGVSPTDLKTLDDLRKFPILTKKIVRERQDAKPILGDLVVASEDDVVFISSSSGSTGAPTASPFSKKDFDEFQEVESRLFWQAGMRPNDRYIHALNFSLFVGGPDVLGAQNLGALCIWGGTLPADRLLFILKQYQPTVIWTTPSYAWYLGETAIRKGINPAKDLAINRIIVAGEPGGSINATRESIEKLWDAEVYDFYGISDIFGACAAACEEHDGLHVAEDHIYVEVLDEKTGLPVGEGERGEMILTTLRKDIRPMIRFRTGDIVTYTNEKCKCGRTLKRIKVVGRLDDMFIAGGVNVFPSDIEHVARKFDELTGEYRVRVFEDRHITRFKVEVEKKNSSNVDIEDLRERLAHEIKISLGVKANEVIILEEGELPRATHKAKRLIDERKEVE
ncbi:AMP-binding protein [Clostridium bornimense]|uniref:phenylacetate--CoA ligase family protein n=1 Tax=Clostridium bornimense TaxID=1216932 RepID=UPI001C105BDC|nr:AMP-binding protein [Clostridium bornimense]MBU5316864.1 AMP-binding protein [Clostridium bornimense]